MSDPDFHSQQSYALACCYLLTASMHAYLTAESLRKRFPEEDWLHLVGLLHDMGKVLSLPAFGLPQWAVVGDTFPVGYGWSLSSTLVAFSTLGLLMPKKLSTFRFSLETKIIPILRTIPPTGYTSLIVVWTIWKCHGVWNSLPNRFVPFSLLGHDEYLYRWALKNDTALPPMALKVIRFHSFYAWHSEGAYQRLLKPEDEETLVWVKRYVASLFRLVKNWLA